MDEIGNLRPRGEAPKPAPTRPRWRFTRRQRLKGRRVIDSVYRRGRRRHHHPLMACVLRRDDNETARLAVSIGKACGSAVQRNAIRRRIREAYRLMQESIPPGVDILLVVRPHKRLAMRDYQVRLGTLLGAGI